MKQSVLLIFLLVSSVYIVYAQEIPVKRISGEIFKNVKKEKDTTTWRWKRNGIVGANIAQGSLSNWAAGGDNFSLSINTFFSYYLYHRAKRYTWDNSFDFNFGFVQATTLGSRKNDDRVDFLSKFGYKIDTVNRWYASALLNVRTQLFDGYNYSGSIANFSSSFLSPAYIVLSLGMDYKPSSKFSLFISPLTSRWVIVANEYLSKQGAYGVPVNKHYFSELGAFITMTYHNEIAKNISYRGRMDLFSNYGNHPGNIDIFFTNMFSFKINKWLSATYNLDMIYDDDIKIFGANNDAPRLQVKSLIGIGFLMKLEPIKK
ncbi:MAG: DUF3078 domain-containing protein [Chitinophagaceae bacterium]|nr:DUF3078 domain-containing protein [Chitinophagaceae bacterium]MCW5905833.1 DUF3078 domain-containing protein [Chitinophagaceae bacterium]